MNIYQLIGQLEILANDYPEAEIALCVNNKFMTIDGVMGAEDHDSKEVVLCLIGGDFDKEKFKIE